MKTSMKRFAVIAIILVVSILLGLMVDFVWDRIEKSTHPKDHLQYVRQYAYEYNIPEPVIFAMIKVESNFNTQAESVAGARGLMQMMQSTFEDRHGVDRIEKSNRQPLGQLIEHDAHGNDANVQNIFKQGELFQFHISVLYIVKERSGSGDPNRFFV